MSQNSTLIKIDLKDPRSIAALEAERKLFDHYQLDVHTHYLEMPNNGLRVRVHEVGEGPPIVMVPGGTGDAIFLASLMAELKGWRIIALNRPGGGLSDSFDHQKFNVRKLAVDTIHTVLETFDLHDVPMICNSMGGLWGFWYALAHPDRLSRIVQLGCPALILESSAPFFMRLLSVPVLRDLIARNMQPKTIQNALEGLKMQGSSSADIARLPSISADAAYHFFHLPTYLPTWKTMISEIATVFGAKEKYKLTADQLGKITLPVQLIWGNNDPFGDLEVGREVVECLPNAVLHELNTGHLPFLDQPEITGQLVRKFLEIEFDNLKDMKVNHEQVTVA